jgi:hypothetical protein
LLKEKLFLHRSSRKEADGIADTEAGQFSAVIPQMWVIV